MDSPRLVCPVHVIARGSIEGVKTSRVNAVFDKYLLAAG
jgi:hypothetical protein